MLDVRIDLLEEEIVSSKPITGVYNVKVAQLMNSHA